MSARVAVLMLGAAILACGQPAMISGPLVVSDRWPQCTDLLTWTRDVMRIEGLQRAAETAQGKALFRWLRLFNRMATGGMIQAYEGEPGNEKYVMDLHKHLFVYGWGYCDTTSRIAEGAWVEFKGDRDAAERVCTMHANGGYHTMYRLRLDGTYGAFDPRYGYYLVERDSPDARVLDWAEVGMDANILKNKTYKHRSAPFFEFFGLEWERAFLIEPAFHVTEKAWIAAGKPIEHVFGDRKYVSGTRYHDMDFALGKGTTIERFWDNSARKFYVPKGKHTTREEAFLPSGRFYRVTETMLDGNWPNYDPNYQKAKPYLATVPTGEGYNKDVAGGRTIGQAWGRITWRPAGGDGTLDFYSPYVLVDGAIEGRLATESVLELRTLAPKVNSAAEPDRWSQWRALQTGPGPLKLTLDGIHGIYRFQLRAAPGALKDLKVQAHFENNVMSIPQIFAGANAIRFKVRDAGAVQGPVTVTYRYQTAQGEKSHVQVLRPADFFRNEATYRLDAPGLIRCKSLAISY